jgi:hypothetical protein
MEVTDRMRHGSCIVVVMLPLLVLQLALPVMAAEGDTLDINPKVLRVGTFFVGGQITISGELGEAEDCVVEVSGPAVSSLYDIKGRMGPFWMNLEQVELDKAPGMYVLLLPAGDSWPDRVALLGLGLEQVKAHLAVSHTDRTKDDVFQMFLDLKRSEGLYAELRDAVSYTPANNGRKRFTAELRLPSSVACGKYVITASVVAGTTKVGELAGELVVREDGFIKLVHDLARKRSLVYGILAVVVALAAGSIMGLLFKRGGSH